MDYSILKFERNKGWLLILTLFVGLAACNNSGSSNKRNLYGSGYLGNGLYNGALCATCGGGQWAIFAGTDSDNGLGTVSLGLDFYGNPMAGYNFADPKIPVFYSGPTIVKGLLTIHSQDSLTCGLPPGQFQVSSINAGNWQGGPQNLRMQAIGNGLNLVLNLANGVINNPSGTTSWYPNRLYGTLVFESVNGRACVNSMGQPAHVVLN